MFHVLTLTYFGSINRENRREEKRKKTPRGGARVRYCVTRRCVAIGIVKEVEVARAMGVCSSAVVGRMVRILKAYGLPTRIPEPVGTVRRPPD